LEHPRKQLSENWVISPEIVIVSMFLSKILSYPSKTWKFWDIGKIVDYNYTDK
jgi:hypothetical protein